MQATHFESNIVLKTATRLLALFCVFDNRECLDRRSCGLFGVLRQGRQPPFASEEFIRE